MQAGRAWKACMFSRGEGHLFLRLSDLVNTSEKGTCESASHCAHSRSALCSHPDGGA